MKRLTQILILVLSVCSLRAETTMATAQISGDDIVKILELDANKTIITFDTPKHVILRYDSNGSSRDFPLRGVATAVSLLTYIPSEEGAVKSCYFWISGAEGATTYSGFPFDAAKAKFWRTTLIDGVFTVIASETEDIQGPFVYRIQILPSDE